MGDPHYVIRGGVAGRERLRILARVMEPSTRALLARAGVRAGMRCLDVGCGGGDVSLILSELVGAQGRVVGLDMDETTVELAGREATTLGRANVSFTLGAVGSTLATSQFDVVYARFLLTHLADPAAALAWMHAHLRPGGVCLVEDIDCRGHFCEPDNATFRRYVELYTTLARRRGADPDIGPRLPGLLLQAGYADVQMQVVQPAGLLGDVKVIAAITLENIVDGLLAEGLATRDGVAEDIAALRTFADDPRSVMSLPRVVQAWGRRPLP
jgi:SAM-dependent methyltransferase